MNPRREGCYIVDYRSLTDYRQVVRETQRDVQMGEGPKVVDYIFGTDEIGQTAETYDDKVSRSAGLISFSVR